MRQLAGFADVAEVGMQLIQDQFEQRRFAGAVAPDKADPPPGRQTRAGAAQNLAAGNPVCDVVNRKHTNCHGRA